MSKQYGSASAQDLYRLCIESGALDMPWWELVDDEDDPVGDDWYVVVNVGTDEVELRRRLGVAQVWAAILACSTGEIDSVDADTRDACRSLLAVEPSENRFNFRVADAVMQVAMYGQVEWRMPHE